MTREQTDKARRELAEIQDELALPAYCRSSADTLLARLTVIVAAMLESNTAYKCDETSNVPA